MNVKKLPTTLIWAIRYEVDFTTGVITNHTKNKTYQAEPFPEFMQEMFKVGGLVEQTKVKLGLK